MSSTVALTRISRVCLQRTRSFQRPPSMVLTSRLGVRATIATQSNRTKAPQAAMVVQATNVDVQHRYLPKKQEARRIRRLSSDTKEDLLVDMEALEALASQPPTPLRLRDMHNYAKTGDAAQRLRNAQFLHHEIPIRMAQRAMDLLTLPHGLSQTSHVRKVASFYLKYIEQFQQTKLPSTAQEEREFTDMLQSIILDRQKIPTSIAQGISSWYKQHQHLVENPESALQEMEDALYRFFTARVGLRFLTQHHILSDPNRTNLEEMEYAHVGKNDLGCIQTDCDPVQEIQNVIQQVTQQTQDCYGCCPEIELVDSRVPGLKYTGFTYVPHHLQYMVTELLKNSCRATVDKYYGQDEKEMPPIRVVVVQGKEDVTVKVCDQGGGAPRSTMDKIWKFAHSTSPSLEQETEFAKDSFSGGKIRGFGLPLARIYARYFGGELTLRSMEGHGVDAYLYLPRLGYQCEKLPSLVKTSPGGGDSTVDLYTMAPIVQRNSPNGEGASPDAAAAL